MEGTTLAKARGRDRGIITQSMRRKEMQPIDSDKGRHGNRRNVIDLETFNRIKTLLARNSAPDLRQIARDCGVSLPTVARISDGTHILQTGKLRAPTKKKLPPKPKPGRGGNRGGYLPTLGEIAKACLSIRSTWDDDRLLTWFPPIYSELDFMGGSQ